MHILCTYSLEGMTRRKGLCEHETQVKVDKRHVNTSQVKGCTGTQGQTELHSRVPQDPGEGEGVVPGIIILPPNSEH